MNESPVYSAMSDSKSSERETEYDTETLAFDMNEIEQIILNENIEFYYKQKIRESLSKYPKDKENKILEHFLNCFIIIVNGSKFL